MDTEQLYRFPPISQPTEENPPEEGPGQPQADGAHPRAATVLIWKTNLGQEGPPPVDLSVSDAVLRATTRLTEPQKTVLQLQQQIHEHENTGYRAYYALLDRIKFYRSKGDLSAAQAHRLITSLDNVAPIIPSSIKIGINASRNGVILRIRDDITRVQEGSGYQEYFELLNKIIEMRQRGAFDDQVAHYFIQSLNSKKYAER